MTKKLAMGFHISSGAAFVGLATDGETLLLDDEAERFRPAEHLAGADQLADFKSRVEQELRRIKPSIVGVVHPRLYSNWQYKAAFTRVSLETAIMLAAHEAGVAYEVVKQERIAKALKLPVTKISEQAAERFGVTPSKYWANRAMAYAAAATLAKAL